MADEAKIKVTVDNSIKVASADFKDLATKVKDLDYQFRQQKITATQLSSSIRDVESRAKELNLTYKQQVDLTAQIFQVNQRAIVGFKSLAQQLHEQTQASNRSQQAFVSLAYIIQDLPYGIRGVANNITQLSQVLGTPIWINLAISGLTSLAVVFDKTLTSAITGANAELDKFNQKSTEASRKFKSYGYGLDARAQFQIQGFSEKKLVSERGYYATQAQFLDEEIRKNERLRDVLKDKEDISDREKKQLKIYEQNIVNLNAQFDAQIVYIRAINDEFERRASLSEKSAKADAKSADEAMKMWIAQMKWRTQMREFVANTFYGGRDTTRPDGGTYGIRFYNPRTDVYGKPGDKLPKAQGVDIAPMGKEEVSKDYKLYDNLFFDPMKQGFNDLNSIIRNKLFGSLDELQKKFGTVGAAIVQALQAVVAKLIETAIMTTILSAVTGGNWGSLFQFLGSGGSAGEAISALRPARSLNTGRVANQMISGSSSSRVQRVIVEGRYRGGDIWLATKDHEAKRNFARI